MSELIYEKIPLHKPSNEEVSEILLNGLKANFHEVSCEVVPCPNLSEAPWGLAMNGLCGSPCIGEIGGVRFLVPLPQTAKIYNIRDVAKMIGYEDGLVIGAGAGPLPAIGKNSEMIPNLRIGGTLLNESRVAKTAEDDTECVLETVAQEETRCSLLLNFYISEGNPGPVLKVKAKNRKGKKDFIGCMRQALFDHYQTDVVGLGGTFLMKKGTAKMHVMPDFSKTPLTSEQEVNAWLKFFDMKGPMIFMSVIASRDPGVDFRMEHTHGYSSTEGGHYHFDITPEEVEYEGYFCLAEHLYRIDKP